MRQALLAGLLLTGGCMTATPLYGAGRCDAARAQIFVGALGTADVGRVAADRARAKALRWLHPGTATTMDYRADRLNIEVDHRNFIRAVRCG